MPENNDGFSETGSYHPSAGTQADQQRQDREALEAQQKQEDHDA